MSLLLNSVVLNNVMSHMDVSQLCVASLVCSKWHKFSCMQRHTWRKLICDRLSPDLIVPLAAITEKAIKGTRFEVMLSIPKTKQTHFKPVSTPQNRARHASF